MANNEPFVHLPLLYFMKNCFLSIFILTSLFAAAQKKDSLKNSIGIQYNYQHFDQQNATDWHLTGIDYSRKTNSGAYTGRVNYASRFQQTGWQVEGESYINLSRKVYAYAGLGYSNDMPVFPKWRSGVSLFVNLPSSWEAEGGARHLYFDKNIFIGVAGLSKYLGSWLLNFRSSASFTQNFNDPSFSLSARKYLRNEKDYFWMQAGSGISPDESRIVQAGTRQFLSSKTMAVGIRKTLSQGLAGTLSGGWSREEYAEARYGNRLNAAIRLEQYF